MEFVVVFIKSSREDAFLSNGSGLRQSTVIINMDNILPENKSELEIMVADYFFPLTYSKWNSVMEFCSCGAQVMCEPMHYVDLFSTSERKIFF